jgi:hypothetical protein
MKAKRQLSQEPSEIDAQTAIFWKSLANNPLFVKLLEHLDTLRDEFDPNRPPSIHPHIQSERNGGIKAWDKLSNLLLNPPA